jgi:hypothetical protein
VLVHDPQPGLDEAVLGIELPRARDLTFHVQGVTDLHRLLEDGVADPAQRDHPVGVQREETDSEGDHEEAVGDLLAEAGAGGPHGVDVLRVQVAGQPGELEDVRLANGASGCREAVARGELLEAAGEEAGARGRCRRGHAARRMRRRCLSARRNSRAAARWPSSEGWKPSSA